MRLSNIGRTTALMAVALAGHAQAATYTVTITADPGDGNCFTNGCTLREAIAEANANPGVDTINFNIPGGGPQLIRPLSPLPDITETVSIDGSTQPGFAGAPMIEVGGDFAGAGADGLRVVNNSSQIGWLSITFHDGDGIEITGSGNASVVGCYLGLGPNGTQIGNDVGIRITNSPNNDIGGTSSSLRNVISGNRDDGVHISGTGSTGNELEGNYIGLNPAGTAAIGNGVTFGHGVYVGSAPGNRIGGASASRRNVISGNKTDGVHIFGVLATGNFVEGNYIGTDAAGTAAIGNGRNGVYTSGPSTTIGDLSLGTRNVIAGNIRGIEVLNAANAVIRSNLIGTDATGAVALPNDTGLVLSNADAAQVGGLLAGNLISGNLQWGMRLVSPAAGLATELAVIEGNYIGTDITGITAVPNGNGIEVVAGFNNTFGGSASGGLRNYVAGNNGWGLVLGTSGGGDVDNNVFQNNWIGATLSGTALGNGLGGVRIHADADSNTFGGIAIAEGNRVQDNGGPGFELLGGTDNEVSGNNIFFNTGLGIDIDGDGYTPNDVDDLDAGPNNRQNHPLMALAVLDATGTQITCTATLQSLPSTTYRIEFFYNEECHPTGYGEGQIFLGAATGGTNASGVLVLTDTFTPTIPMSLTDFVTATATDIGGDTSEFSPCLEIESASCGPGAGNCYDANGSAGCENGDCCNLVCNLDSYCCETEWDALCVAAALSSCGGCGDPQAGMCHLANGSPGCNDGDCCAVVCAADPFCCDSEWDSLCASTAISMCTLTCVEDCAEPVDGTVDVSDLLALLAQWGGPGSCDTDASGSGDVADLLAVLAKWGACP